MAENKRMKIVALKQAGHSSKDVAKMVSVDLKTVYNVMKRFNDWCQVVDLFKTKI